MSASLGAVYLESVTFRFRGNKKLAEGGLRQLSDEQLTLAPAPASNSIAVLLQHLHGNMISRWTDFLTTDGEKPTRDRDAEFILDASLTRKDRMERWEEGWRCLFDTLASLQPSDLEREVVIRGEKYSVLDAIERQVFHISYHVGQILYIAKLLKQEGWTYLSIKPGESRKHRWGRD